MTYVLLPREPIFEGNLEIRKGNFIAGDPRDSSDMQGEYFVALGEKSEKVDPL